MTEDTTVKQLYRRAIPSVVSVYVTGDESQRGGAGSGFVYDEAHLITNQHVVGGSDDVELRFHDGAWRTATVVGADPYTDLAVLRVDDLPDDAAPSRSRRATPSLASASPPSATRWGWTAPSPSATSAASTARTTPARDSACPRPSRPTRP